MNDLARFSVTAPVETVLKKLSKYGIAAYRLKKQGATVCFSVREEYTQKVFAIFRHPCYNVAERRKSAKHRVKAFLKRRFGLVVGAVLFVALCVLSDGLVLRIKVTGNGSYLSPQIVAAATECGARLWSPCASLDRPLLQSRILAMPSVTFCSVQRYGSYLVIDVRTEEEHAVATDYRPLTAPSDGEIYRIVAVCGTPEKKEGDKVSAGDTLIGAYTVDASGQRAACLAVGFAEIKRSAVISVFAECDDGEHLASAYAAVGLYADRVLEKSHRVSPCEGGVTYEISFTYLVTVAVNMQ